MIAKLIVHAPTRESAARKLAEACAEVEVWPVKTNAGFLARCAGHSDFVAADVDTAFIEQRLAALVGLGQPSPAAAALAAAAFAEMDALTDDITPWTPLGGATGFRLNSHARAEMRLSIAGETLVAPLIDADFDLDGGVLITDEDQVVVFDGGDVFAFGRASAAQSGADGAVSNGQLLSPMPGRVVSVGADKGAKVAQGQAIVILEAMKMEHALVAPFDGLLAELSVKAGDQVSEGVVLARIEKAS